MNQRVLRRILPATNVVIVYNCQEIAKAAIVHIWRREHSVPQRWCAELSVIGRIMSDIFTAYVRIYDIKTCRVICVVGKINSTMAFRAICFGTVEQRKSIFRRSRKSCGIALHVSVIGTLTTNKRALEGSNCLFDMRECNWACSAECFRKHFAVIWDII